MKNPILRRLLKITLIAIILIGVGFITSWVAQVSTSLLSGVITGTVIMTIFQLWKLKD